MAELDSLTVFLAGLALLAIVLFARTLYNVRKEHRHLHKKTQDKTASLEFQAQSLKSDFR